MKVLVGAFNQEKALVGAFSMIVKTNCDTDGALHSTGWAGVSSRRVKQVVVESSPEESRRGQVPGAGSAQWNTNLDLWLN